MTRLKFLLFVLVALGLWGYHLTVVGPAMSNGAVDAATDTLLAASTPVALALEAQRSKLQAAVMAVAGSPAALNAGPKGKTDPPSADRFNAVRDAAAAALPEADRASLVVILVNENGALVAQGAGDPGEAPEGLEPSALAMAGFAGTTKRAFDAPYVFYATPQLVSDRNEVKPAGSAVLGLPLLPDAEALVSKLVKDRKLSAAGIAIEGKKVAAAGPDQPEVDAVLKLAPGTVAPLKEGPAKLLGPLALPLMVPRQVLDVGLNQPIDGAPVSVAVAATVRPAMETLASYQVFALGGLGGLLFLSIVLLVLLGSGEEAHGPAMMVVPSPMPAPSGPPAPAEPAMASSASSPALPFPDQVPDHEPAPEASPDDFDFPSSPSTLSSQPSQGSSGLSGVFMSTPSMPDTGAQAEDDPFAMMGPPPPARQAPPPPPPPAPPPAPASFAATQQSPAYRPGALMDDDDVGERTAAYPQNFMNPGVARPSGPTVDPFAMAGGQLSAEEQSQGEDYNPDATRVAAVPQELIKQARSAGGAPERPQIRSSASLPRVQSVAPVAAAGNDEERHFQEVFRDFVATREKCGEPSDGLTFDKFRAKLVKNKDQLTAKYNCRTVRFQVYVKDGKAALKATPVKD